MTISMKIVVFSICTLLISVMAFVKRPLSTISLEMRTMRIRQQEVFLHNIPKSIDVNSVSAIKGWIFKTFDEVKISGLEIDDIAINPSQNFYVHGYGKVMAYSIRLQNVGFTGIHTAYYLVINTVRREGCLFALDTLNPISVSNGKAKNIGGRLVIRSKEFYINYSFRKDRFVLAFDTYNFCDHGIIVGSFRPECLNYTNERLTLEYQDLNKDKIEDIIFKGTVEYYCKPLVDRDEAQKEPIKRENVSIEFLSFTDSSGIHWMLKDKDICGKTPVN